MADDPRTVYQRRQAYWNAEIARHEARHLQVSNLRLAAVAAFGLLLWLAIGRDAVPGALVLAPIALFFLLLPVHARVLNARDRALRARGYYDRGLSRLDETWKGHGESGDRFLEGHPYARDLDLFGDASLFQRLTTARTQAGEDTLARWLGAPASATEVLARQGAVRELAARQDVREALAIFAAEARVSRTGSLAAWAQAHPAGLTVMHLVAFAAVGLVTAAVLVLVFTERVPLSVAIGWAVVPGGLNYLLRRQTAQALSGVDAAADDLALLAALLERVEHAAFDSPRLNDIRARLTTEGQPPSRRIRRLEWYLAARDSLRNEFVRPFAMVLQVRGQSAVAIDRWHQAHRHALAHWLEAIGELEALCALATFAFEHPDAPYPQIADGAPQLVAEALWHPLLPAASAVANDVALGPDGARVLIVSGSNMSGKSTLLRAVGVNVVLALAGAPVCARTLRLSVMTPGATLRVQDSLDEGQSRFYAEILRIRDIVTQARQQPTLFLLDEILHGTNSHDRRIGADAIVRSLVDDGAIGIVTTHDLALTRLSESLPGARNVHFEDRLEDGHLIFDYRMRDGVVERSNALELMRAVGIRV